MTIKSMTVCVWETHGGEKDKYHLRLEHPANVPGASVAHPLTWPPIEDIEHLKTSDGGNGLVRRVGDFLRSCLAGEHAVGRALDAALLTSEGQRSSIFLQMEPPEVDELPWECIVGPENKFLALDNRWPIARLARLNISSVKVHYNFSGSLKVLAVLSAPAEDSSRRISAREEADRLWDRLVGSGLPFDLKLLVCEDDLKADFDALDDSRVSCEFIRDKGWMLDTIRKFRPNLLHFFCHGTAEGVPHLRIGTRVDWIGDMDGRIALEAHELGQSGDPDKNVWLVVLNCCESAASALGGPSLAKSLAAHGFPAVVGMREQVDGGDANLFSERFYAAALSMLEALRPNQDPEPIEWAAALYQARQALINKRLPQKLYNVGAQDCKEWTIPVLYTRQEPFLLKRWSETPSLDPTEKLRLFSEYEQLWALRREVEELTDIPPDRKSGVLDDLDQRLKELEQR